MIDWKFLFDKYVLKKHRTRAGISATEPLVVEHVKRCKGNVALDVGAGTGEYTLMLAKRFRQVYAFEPNPDRANRLRVSLERARAKNVIVVEAALAEQEERTTLWLDPPAKRGGAEPASTIMRLFEYNPASPNQQEYRERYQGTEGVSVKTIPLSGLGLRGPIDLMKVDVEGAEFQVLAGAASLLAGQEIVCLILELHNKDEKPHLESLLRGYGYRLHWIDADHVLAKSN